MEWSGGGICPFSEPDDRFKMNISHAIGRGGREDCFDEG